MKHWQHYWKFSLLFIAFVLGGCSAYHERIADYRTAYANGRTSAAVHEIESLYEKDGALDTDYDAIVLSLEASQAMRFAGIAENDAKLIAESQNHLARVDRLYNHYKAKGGASIYDYTASTLTLADAFPYLGTRGEAIMTSLYQMLTSMQLGDMENARLYAARLYARQKENVAANAQNITEEREKVVKSSSSDVDMSKYASQMDTMTQTMREILPDTRGYDLYVNPFAEYLIAFFHYYCGQGREDLDVAQQCIRRSLGMNPNSAFLKDEVKRFSSTTARQVEPTVYLIHEAGLGPSIEDRKIMIPVIAGGTATVFSMAYPVLKADENCHTNASLVTQAGVSVTEEICSMDAVLAKEFDNSYVARMTHAITICAVKSAIVLGSQIASRKNDMAQASTMIGGNIYLLATNIADTRTCNSFPKSFGVARTAIPKNRKVQVQLDGRPQKELQLPTDGDVWVIYMRSFHRHAKPVITYFKVR